MEEQQLKHFPGFRFHPTEEELVGFYLRRKAEKKPFKVSVIQELDLYAFEPWELPGLCLIEGERQWFFFVKPRGHNDGRPNRITSAGFWKATGSDRPIYNRSTSTLIGLKKTLVFYEGRALKGHKTDWIMNEYRLHPSVSENGGSVRLCRVYRKATSMKSLDSQATSQVEKRVNNCENTALSSSVMANEQLQENSAHSFAYCKENISTTKVEMEVTEEDLKWLCWDGRSSIF